MLYCLQEAAQSAVSFLSSLTLQLSHLMESLFAVPQPYGAFNGLFGAQDV